MSTDRLRIGIVGTDAIARTHIERINTRLNGAAIVACADPVESFGKSVAEKYSLRFFDNCHDLIGADEIDAVIVTSANDRHEEHVLSCIANGKSVFCEKPLAPDSDACRRIVDAEVGSGRQLVQVGFMRRYDPGYVQLRHAVTEGRFGDLLMVHSAHRNFENYALGGFCDTRMTIENSMIHEIDVIRWLIGEAFVSAELRYPKKTRHSPESVHDPLILILKSESGIFVDIEAFLNCRYGYDIQCELCFEEGCMALPEPANATIRTNASRLTPICADWSERFVYAYDLELQDWIISSRVGLVNGPGAWDGYLASLTAAAACRATESASIEKIEIEPCPQLYRKHTLCDVTESVRK